MIDIGDQKYPLLLLDTNFLTRLFDRPEERARRLLQQVDLGATVFAVSVFSLTELRDRPAVYRKLIRTFAYLPLVILKSAKQLHHEELAAYPDP